ncbi:hypothetical protein FIBSPDRAFT_427821 [Athelia psychrophila]|uniref:Uncharacterized protein n=1 Tax=Athelia psychrophila TaxID=1759441 RepID=A0A166MTZ4_9AGAM|nr:hypothetical protein FIBSPDRAFT_427821 [Fibularhizoctonia sp. CBS 109695]
MKERVRPPIFVPELSDMIIDILHADVSNPTFLVIHRCCSMDTPSCQIRPAPTSAWQGIRYSHRQASVTAVNCIPEALLESYSAPIPVQSPLAGRGEIVIRILRAAQWQSIPLRAPAMLHSRTRPSSCTTHLGSRVPNTLLISQRDSPGLSFALASTLSSPHPDDRRTNSLAPPENLCASQGTRYSPICSAYSYVC